MRRRYQYQKQSVKERWRRQQRRTPLTLLRESCAKNGFDETRT
jgi:hypothetical protein